MLNAEGGAAPQGQTESEQPPKHIEDVIEDEPDSHERDELVPKDDPEIVVDEIRGNRSMRDSCTGFLAFLGPGFMIAMGFIDPGNITTSIEAGSAWGYQLLWVQVVSLFLSLYLQTLAARLGLATGDDLAVHSAKLYPSYLSFMMYLTAQIVVIANDLTDILGTAIGLNILFKLPMIYALCITFLDTFLIFMLQSNGAKALEGAIAAFLAVIAACFVAQAILAKPNFKHVMRGFIPMVEYEAVQTAIAVVGSNVMPHGLYLHSWLMKEQQQVSRVEIKTAVKYARYDMILAAVFAFVSNASLVIAAAATFHVVGWDVKELKEAAKLFGDILRSDLAMVIFGLALVAAGQSATVSTTLSGQIILEGFTGWRVNGFLRRFVTRCISLCPAIAMVAKFGDSATYDLLIFTQIIVAFCLPFALVPLLSLVQSDRIMGKWRSSNVNIAIAWLLGLIVIITNSFVLVQISLEDGRIGLIVTVAIANVAMIIVLILMWRHRVDDYVEDPYKPFSR
eukprot:GFYU01018556.1.p1 GENE.GFYU01018556.1~~GFYU01018556.1.p1  ORF type:complete len:508 (-),score=98.77 GFYU01018556.1:73-1596(-)